MAKKNRKERREGMSPQNISFKDRKQKSDFNEFHQKVEKMAKQRKVWDLSQDRKAKKKKERIKKHQEFLSKQK